MTLKGHENGVAGVAFSPDGKRLASSDVNFRGGEVKVWDAKTGQQLFSSSKVVPRFSGGVGPPLNVQTLSNVAFSPDGKRLAGAVGQVKLWDARTGQELLAFGQAFGPDGMVAFSPHGQCVSWSS